MNYANAFSKLGRWALGQRVVHDLVVHPIMALTNYSNWSVKLHDYHAFTTLTPSGGGLVGITGATPDVERVFARLGIEPEHYHTDGMLCYGLGDLAPQCERCGGSGYITVPGVGRGEAPYHVPCPDCRPKRRGWSAPSGGPDAGR